MNFFEDLLDLAPVGVLIVISVGILLGAYSCSKAQGKEQINNYLNTNENFIANGKSYKCDDVDYFNYDVNTYQSDAIIFYMKDGTVIHCTTDNITWEN